MPGNSLKQGLLLKRSQLILLDWLTWQEKRPSKLQVILNPDDTRKLILPGDKKIVAKESGVEEVKERWSALFIVDEINAEFMRITIVHFNCDFWPPWTSTTER